MTICHDLATNEADLKKLRELFTTHQTSTTTLSLLLPWLPSPARKVAKQASTAMYIMLYTYVETRRGAEPTSDAIDILIADGETTQNIVGVSPTSEVVRDFAKSDLTLQVRHGGAFRRYHWHWHSLYVSTGDAIRDN